jgi:hypothetical protein
MGRLASEYDSWEPAEHLANAQRKVKEFEKAQAKKRTERANITTRTVTMIVVAKALAHTEHLTY